jgi:hypothetical protein
MFPCATSSTRMCSHQIRSLAPSEGETVRCVIHSMSHLVCTRPARPSLLPSGASAPPFSELTPRLGGAISPSGCGCHLSVGRGCQLNVHRAAVGARAAIQASKVPPRALAGRGSSSSSNRTLIGRPRPPCLCSCRFSFLQCGQADLVAMAQGWESQMGLETTSQ